MNYLNIKDEQAHATVVELNILLADYRIYYQNLRNFHCNILGENFFQLHEKFEELKTASRGFAKDHPAINLLRKKQFIFIKKYTDKEVLATDFTDDVHQSFKDARPYLDYMSDVLTTNLNGESII